MAASGVRSFGASVIGWLIVAIVIYVFFGGILSAIRFVFRAVLFLVIVGVLLTAYFRLRGD